MPNTSRPVVAALLALLLALMAVPAVGASTEPDEASATSYDYRSGYEPCAGWRLTITTEANGEVFHLLDGGLIGYYYNGPFTLIQSSWDIAIDGEWEAVANYGYIYNHHIVCDAPDEDDDDPDPDPGPLGPSKSGFRDCGSSTVTIKSVATGNVGHSIYGQTLGTWNNGSTFMTRTSGSSFNAGSWYVWSDQDVQLDNTDAHCS